MPKIAYINRAFKPATRKTIGRANEIIREYEKQGFQLTLRQLYYQFVARGLLSNNLKSYKWLGEIVNDARLAGLIDWNHITDRTRELRGLAHWDSPADIISSAAYDYRVDLWERQKFRPEVWIEKDALVGVIEGVCAEMDVPFFSCRGYTSQSEMWGAARRLSRWARGGQTPVVLHFGDHDPSGKDMTRDIQDRLTLFKCELEVHRLALNMDQVSKYAPPPNPAKVTDSRAEGYIAEFGAESWELDALEPKVLADLIRTALKKLIDQAIWKEDQERAREGRRLLEQTASRWSDVVDVIGGGDKRGGRKS